MVERENWSYPVPVKHGQDGPLPNSVVPLPDKTLGQQLVEMEAEWAADDPEGEVLDGFTPDQIETIQTAAEMNLATIPDPEAFAAAFDQCPEGVKPALWLAVRKKVAGILARSPHIRGERLFKAVFDSLNLAETAAADEWLAQNPQFFG